ncbi:MAG TPA: hypothetical protein VGW74_04150, partial [Propionibacteriaceae bacterium]|nr:hypothetical protein [Propionibacteriaceae bacterium]
RRLPPGHNLPVPKPGIQLVRVLAWLTAFGNAGQPAEAVIFPLFASFIGDRPTRAAITHDQAEQYERLRQGAEALAQLKPQEIRALQLTAEGYSYRD